MKVRVLSPAEQRLIQAGLARLGDRAADELYGQLHASDGVALVLVDNREREPYQDRTQGPHSAHTCARVGACVDGHVIGSGAGR